MSEELSPDQYEKVLIVLGASLLIIGVVLAGATTSLLGMDEDDDSSVDAATDTQANQATPIMTEPEGTRTPPEETPRDELADKSDRVSQAEGEEAMLDVYVILIESSGIEVVDHGITSDGDAGLIYRYEEATDIDDMMFIAELYSVVAGQEQLWTVDRLRVAAVDEAGNTVKTFAIETYVAWGYYYGLITDLEYGTYVVNSETWYTETPTDRPQADDSSTSRSTPTYAPTPTEEDGFEFPGNDTPTPTEGPTPTPAPTITPTDSTSTPTEEPTPTPTPTPDGTTPTPTTEPTPTPTQTPDGTTSTTTSTPTPTPTPDGTTSTATPTPTPTPTSTKA